VHSPQQQASFLTTQEYLQELQIDASQMEELSACVQACFQQPLDKSHSSGAGATISKSNGGRGKLKLVPTHLIGSAPLANKDAPILDIKAMKGTVLHNPAIQKWNLDFAASFAPDTVCDIKPDPSSVPVSHGMPDKLFDMLLEIKTIERVTDEMLAASPSAAGAKLFVIENDKPEGMFHRVICWTQRQNAALNSPSSKWRSKTHMYGPGHYTPAIADEAAAVADIYSGFSHIQIPEKSRRWFRVIDSKGNVWQLTRLPMGLCSAVALMETVSFAIIGSPVVCKPEAQIFGVRSDAWVDDVRISGTLARVTRGCEFIIKRCLLLNVRLKQPPVPVTKYTYIGTDYDLRKEIKEISINEKTLKKLPETVGSSMSAGLLIRTVARLTYCCGPLSILLGDFYYTMKQTTQVANKVNKKVLRDDDIIKIPDGLRKSLSTWIARVKQPRSYLNEDWTARAQRRQCTLFTDASLHGWGAFMITANGNLYISGGKWSTPSSALTSSDIGWLEARALTYSVTAFRTIIEDHGRLDLRIDNTSVVAAVHRGRARAHLLHTELVKTIHWLHNRRIITSVSYVRSADNVIADNVSRGVVPTREAAIQTRDRVLAGESIHNTLVRWSP